MILRFTKQLDEVSRLCVVGPSAVIVSSLFLVFLRVQYAISRETLTRQVKGIHEYKKAGSPKLLGVLKMRSICGYVKMRTSDPIRESDLLKVAQPRNEASSSLSLFGLSMPLCESNDTCRPES